MPNMSEHLNLCWNSYKGNLGASMKELRESKDFFDVTLASEDDQIQCHKLVLSACSPLLLNILRHNFHPHPLIYLKGVKFKHLLLVLDFMYEGQVNVSQEDLASFMATAEELKVKGLTLNNECEGEEGGGSPVEVKKAMDDQQTITVFPPYFKNVNSNSTDTINFDEFTFLPTENTPTTKLTPVLPHPSTSDRIFSQNPFSLPTLQHVLTTPGFRPILPKPAAVQDIDKAKIERGNKIDIGQENIDYGDLESNKSISEKCKSLIVKNQDGYFQCLVCEFKNEKRISVRNHVESHVPFSKVCNICNKNFKNRSSLHSHKNQAHKMSKLKATINNIRDDIISSATCEMTGMAGTPLSEGLTSGGLGHLALKDRVTREASNNNYDCGITEEENTLPWENNNQVSTSNAGYGGNKEYEEECINNLQNIDEVSESVEESEDNAANLHEGGESEIEILRSNKVDLSSSTGDNDEYLDCGDPWDLKF